MYYLPSRFVRAQFFSLHNFYQIFFSFSRWLREPESAGSMVDSVVHRLVRWPRRFLPDRQLFGMVLPSRGASAELDVRAARGYRRTAARRCGRHRCHGNAAAALSPIRTAALRLGELRRARRQSVRRENRHIRYIGAGSQHRSSTGAGVEEIEIIERNTHPDSTKSWKRIPWKKKKLFRRWNFDRSRTLKKSSMDKYFFFFSFFVR